MQEVDVNLHAGEKKTKIERFQQYGFTSVPLKESDSGQQGGSGGGGSGGSGGGQQQKGKAAEALVAFLGANRSHAVVFMVDDRRHRLKNMKPGESAMYDDQGQRHMIRRGGVTTSVPKGMKITKEVVEAKQQDDKSKDKGQDVDEERKPLTSVVQGHDFFEFKVGDKTTVRFDQDKGVSFKTDKDITSTADGVIQANGETKNWKGPKEDGV